MEIFLNDLFVPFEVLIKTKIAFVIGWKFSKNRAIIFISENLPYNFVDFCQKNPVWMVALFFRKFLIPLVKNITYLKYILASLISYKILKTFQTTIFFTISSLLNISPRYEEQT